MILVNVERLARSYFAVVVERGLATRLVEETETHVLVGLLLLLLLGGLGSGLLSSTASGRSSATRSGTTTGSTRGNGSELGRALLDELVDVLALKLGDQLLETVVVGLDTDGFEDRL
jgi:predicted permease